MPHLFNFALVRTCAPFARGVFSVFVLLTAAALLLPASAAAQRSLFTSTGGQVNFTSDAPLELIQASSDRLRGAIDTQKRTFAFAVLMTSFQGFNSSLQRQHFNDNYMESDRYPEAYFSGKIIEEIDFSQNGTYTVRAKGKLTIHNVTQERIIRSQVTIRGKEITINSTFEVPLKDHRITIPKIVSQKIAESINVTIGITMRPR